MLVNDWDLVCGDATDFGESTENMSGVETTGRGGTWLVITEPDAIVDVCGVTGLTFVKAAGISLLITTVLLVEIGVLTVTVGV